MIIIIINTGITVNTPSGKMVSKARLLMCAVDLPARASVLNMKQFNGSGGVRIVKMKGFQGQLVILSETGPTPPPLPQEHTEVL